MPAHDSLADLLQRWRSGDQSAAAAIYARYEQRLLNLASRRISPRLRARIDPEDIMLSVMNTVLRRLGQGQYSVDPSGTLWNLVQAIAENKIRKQAEHHGAGMRNVGAEAVGDGEVGSLEASPNGMSPEEAAILADELEDIRKRLKPANFEVFELMLEGYSLSDIGRRLGRARQTVRYRAERVKELLDERAREDRG
jgi:RNA polymerase sigma factor (sigma-70 family)